MEEFILQGWHVVMFVVMFLLGMLAGISLLKPYIDAMNREIEKEEDVKNADCHE